MDKQRKHEMKRLREALRTFDQAMWKFISYCQETYILPYDAEYLTTNEGMRRRASRYLEEFRASVEGIDHPLLDGACSDAERNIKKIVSKQPRTHVRFHLNNARTSLLSRMERDRSSRVAFEWRHPEDW